MAGLQVVSQAIYRFKVHLRAGLEAVDDGTRTANAFLICMEARGKLQLHPRWTMERKIESARKRCQRENNHEAHY